MAEIKYVDWDGLVYYDGRVKQFVNDKLEDCIKYGGAVTYADLPTPSFQNLNYIYKITEDFTSNRYFEKPGYIYKAGTVVQVSDLDNVYLFTIFDEMFSDCKVPPHILEELDNISGRINQVESRLKRVETDNSQYDSLSDQIDETISKVEEIESTQKRESSRIDSVEDRITTVESRADALEEDVEALEDNVSTLETRVSDLESKSTITDEQLEQTLVDYAKVSDIPTIPENVSAFENDAGYITEEALTDYVTTADVADTLKDYAKSEDISAEIENKTSEFVKETDVRQILSEETANFATEEYVQSQISEIDIPSVDGFITADDLNEYAKKTEIPTNVSEFINDAEYITKDALAGYATEEQLASKADKEYVDTILEGYYTAEDVDRLFEENAAEEVDLEAYLQKDEAEATYAKKSDIPTTVSELEDAEQYVTFDDLELKGYLTEHQDISNLASKDELEDKYTQLEDKIESIEVPDVSNFVTREEVDGIVDNKVDTSYLESNYYDKEVIDQKIADAITGGEVDLESYLKTEVAEATYAKIEDIPSLDEYAKVDAIPTKVSDLDNDVPYLTEHQDISGLATKEEVESKYSDLDQKIDQIDVPDVSNFVTQEDIDRSIENKVDKSYVDSNFYDKSTVDQKIAETIAGGEIDLEGYLKVDVAESTYAKIGDIPDLDGYAKTEDIPTKVSDLDNDVPYLTEHQDISNLASKSELESKYDELKDQIDSIDIPDVSSFVTQEDIDAAVEGKVDKSYVDSALEDNYYDKETVDEMIASAVTGGDIDLGAYLKTETAEATYAKIGNIPTKVSDLDNDVPYLTEHQDISGLATQQELTEKYNELKEQIEDISVPDVDNFVTEDALQDYVKASDLESKDYVTEADLEDKGYLTEHQDLSEYAKTADVDESLKKKADEVPFTDDMIVGKAIGGFVVGDSLKDMTVREILEKLLHAQIDPDAPVEKYSPMLVGKTGELSESSTPKEFLHKQMTQQEAKSNYTDECYYEIVDDQGSIIEQGYQFEPASTGRTKGVLAIPEGMTLTKILVWDPMSSQWAKFNKTFNLSTTLTVNGSLYNVYEVDSNFGNIQFRFVIELD